jgi:hypothetical protein
VCATKDSAAAQNAGTDSGADHQDNHVGFALASSAPTFAEDSSIAIAFYKYGYAEGSF